MATNILVLDTPSEDLLGLCRTLRRASPKGARVRALRSTDALLARLDAGSAYDLVVVDWHLGDGTTTGAELLRRIRAHDAVVPVVAVAEHGDVELANRAIGAGATDFLVRGERLHKRVSTLLGKVRGLLELLDNNRVLREQNMLLREEARARYRIIGESPEISGVIRVIERVAVIPRPVLIVGERGTGKELVARAIHEASGAAPRPFVAVNCAAFTDALLESELFGHEKGSFTGADATAHGRFEQAGDGTLFLDEIGNMSLAFQRKILRAVEYGVITRVGGRSEVRIGARILSATNADLEEKMRRGEFLRDLYDRLAFEVIEVPALRERRGDVEVLSRHFLREFMREIPALDGKRLAPTALEVLRAHRFPGNVRELKNIIERAAYRDTTQEITPEDLGFVPAGASHSLPAKGGFDERVEAFKRSTVLEALDRARGNQSRAARDLGLSYHRFRYLQAKYAQAD